MSAVAPLTLYFREGCHLCDDMQALITELLEPHSYTIKRVDIDTDPQLQHRYNEHVPVLLLGDRELCRHFLDLKTVEAALAGYNSVADR